MLLETYREGQKELHCVFVELEYLRVLQHMCEDRKTMARCTVGVTDR